MCAHTIDEWIPSGHRMMPMCDKFCIPVAQVNRKFPKNEIIFAYTTYAGQKYDSSGQKNQKRLVVCALGHESKNMGLYVDGQGGIKPTDTSSDTTVYVWTVGEIHIAQQIWINANILAVTALETDLQAKPKKEVFEDMGVTKYHYEMSGSNWEQTTDAHAGFLHQNVHLVSFYAKVRGILHKGGRTRQESGSVTAVPENTHSGIPDFGKVMTEFNLAYQKKFKSSPSFVYSMELGKFVAHLHVDGKNYQHEGGSKSVAAGMLVYKFRGDILDLATI